MSESGAPPQRAALAAGIEVLGRLRNQTGPTMAFKKWRQSMIGTIGALWPEDRAKVSRLLRIPFLPASAKADRMELRRVYDRGCGEAVTYLKGLLAEYDREVTTGQRATDPASGAAAPASPIGSDGLPNLSWLDAGVAPAAEAELPPEDMEALRSVADEFLSASPVFSVANPANPGRPAGPGGAPQELSPTALAIMAMAVEVESLGVPEGDRPRVREALLDLARKLDSRMLTWRQLRMTVEVVMEYPTIGRRVLPLIVPFLDRAA
jgi:hypothetical protein